MKQFDIVVPVQQSASTIAALLEKIDRTLSAANISYHCLLIDLGITPSAKENIALLAQKYSLSLITKDAQLTQKSFLARAWKNSTAPYLAVVDPTMVYPIEMLPKLYAARKNAGLVVAKKHHSKQHLIHHILHIFSEALSGEAIHEFEADKAFGMKLFRREVVDYMFQQNLAASTIGPILATQALGYPVKIIKIETKEQPQASRQTKYQLHVIKEMLLHRLKNSTVNKKPLSISPDKDDSMAGAGLVHHRQRYITHTTLLHQHSAIETFTLLQKLVIFAALSIILFGLWTSTLTTVKILVAILSFFYFIDVVFNLFLILKSLHAPPEIKISQEKIEALEDKKLPVYTILCPLYKEAQVLPQFLAAIDRLDWPKKKLDVILLLEADDVQTIEAAQSMDLPTYVRILIVPDSHPKTKPKACNFGLNHAKGEFVVIYDAEDAPDSDQLKKVYAAFQSLPQTIKCIQAKLNYYNPHQNLLTRFFTAEYSLWFDVILTGLQTINTTIPLGGTSNHFRTRDLLELQGWDPFNVTEDCDLGVRLFKHGGRTAVIDSVTLEEANSNFTNWLRQRSRWIKGYMQTYLLHMRSPLNLIKAHGWHALILQLSLGGKIAFLLINPIMWLLTLSYFLLYAYVGPAIDALYPAVIFYMAVFSLVFGNFMFIYYYMIGVAKREHWGVMKYVLIIPIYWLMASVAALIALHQLIFKPHYWEKTIHGLHLSTAQFAKPIQEKTEKNLPAAIDATIKTETSTPQKILSFSRMRRLWKNTQVYFGGMLLVGGSIFANLLNFVFNAYLGRRLSLSEFGTLSLFSSFVFLSLIPIGALMAAMSHKVGFVEGRSGENTTFAFWSRLGKKSVLLALAATAVWLAATPLLMWFFNTPSAVPFLLFAPMLLLGIPAAIDKGFLSGRLVFAGLALIITLDALVKLLAAVVFVETGFSHWVYLAIPSGLILAFAVGRMVIARGKRQQATEQNAAIFPRKFFATSLLAGISQMSFLSLDVLLVKHFMSSTQAGEYALISLVGKMVFFAGSMAAQFVIPLVSRNEGAQKDSKPIFSLTLIATLLLSTVGVVVLGIFSPVTTPLLLGDKIIPLTPLLPLFSFGVLCFAVGQTIVNYYLAKKNYLFALIPFSITLVQIGGLFLFHTTLEQVVSVMTTVGVLNLIFLAILHRFNWVALSLQNNFDALLSLLSQKGLATKQKQKSGRLRILMFNWYDTKHTWAGGAEYYVHNIAKTLVENGHKVTIFCGNDGNNPRNEVVDGVQVVRRGGLFTVPVWACIYYLLKFRGLFDVVIDSAKGVPFFTPLYVRKPIVALICHVHQEMFKLGLPFPLANVAMSLEKIMMPAVYRWTPLVTISESSKKAIQKLGFGKKKEISIAIPGVSIAKSNVKKTKHPSVLYLGRLRDYKSVDITIKAIDRLREKIPNIKFTIAGDGDARPALEQLVATLQLKNHVRFLSRVSEERKAKLFSQSWVAVHPSIVEGWGITNIEANYCATPVVASDVDGLRDSVQHNKTGLLVPPRDVQAFATAIETVLTDKKLRKTFGSQCQLWAKNFSWEKSAEMFLESLESQLKRKNNQQSVA